LTRVFFRRCFKVHETVSYLPVPGFPAYLVGSDGSVWRDLRGSKDGRKPPRRRRLKPAIDRGYLKVGLSRDGKLHRVSVHKLVLLAFVGDCPEGCECRHLNGVSTDNRVGNLCWATHAVNMQDRKRHGTSLDGQNNPSSRLSWRDVAAIRRDYVKGSKTSGSIALAKRYGVAQSTILRAVKVHNWQLQGA
jgi:HNH endonuclease